MFRNSFLAPKLTWEFMAEVNESSVALHLGQASYRIELSGRMQTTKETQRHSLLDRSPVSRLRCVRSQIVDTVSSSMRQG